MDERTAYMHSASKQDTLSRSPHGSCLQPHDLSAAIVTSGCGFSLSGSASPRSAATPRAPGQHSSDAVDGVPASSTPDLLSPNTTSSASSPDVPLTQKAFSHRLHALLQFVLDQKRDERGASTDGSECECERTIPSRNGSEYHSDYTLRPCVSWPAKLVDYSESDNDPDRENTSSGTSSANSLGVWAPSPDDDDSDYEDESAKAPLTHRNKRKHDESHNFSNSSDFEGCTTALEDGGSRAGKKAKLDANSFTSTTSSFSYQTSETASARKLRSLSSTSPCRASSVSRVVDSPVPRVTFLHPILHPPTEPLQVPRSRREIAEARIKALLTREALYRVQDGLPAGSFGPAEGPFEQEDILGIEPAFRHKVVQWILDVLPPPYLKTEGLYQHLECCEETRFHAMYLFTRFFLRMGECGERRRQKETKLERRARREYTWDTAFCCLAISTKFYHDFLRPLAPIDARSFLAMSPQLLSHDQFESLQRNVLDSFAYNIYGVTPHAYFEELLDALPSLREILKSRRARQIARDEMWESLQLAALQSDIMRFPVALLTAAVLVDAIVVVLVDRSGLEADSDGSAARADAHLGKAREDVQSISTDIVALLGVSHGELRECRRWLALVAAD